MKDFYVPSVEASASPRESSMAVEARRHVAPPALTRKHMKYLRDLAKCNAREGWRWVDRSHWNDPTFQALLQRGYVRYAKPSLRARTVSITILGRAFLENAQ